MGPATQTDVEPHPEYVEGFIVSFQDVWRTLSLPDAPQHIFGILFQGV